MTWVLFPAQVKDAFRRLVLQYHPDKCAPDVRVASEAKVKEIKNAYETILRVQVRWAVRASCTCFELVHRHPLSCVRLQLLLQH